MNPSELFIRRPVMTLLLTVAVILFGIAGYKALPVNDLPAIDYPVISVSVSYPGASPQTMANNVATPLERQFMQIPGLELVTSQSSQGNCSMSLQFDLSKSIDAAATDVQAAITQASANLPLDLPSPPTYTKTNPNDQPIMYIALASDTLTKGQLYDYASTQVRQSISILPGVSQVQIYGSPSAVRIKVDPSAMAVRQLSVDDLAAAVQRGTSYSEAGQFDGQHRTFLLQPQGQLDSAAQYANLIVAIRNRAPVYLRDVAECSDSLQDQRIDMRFWKRGYPVPTATVVAAVYRQAGSNAVEIAKSVRDLLPIIKAELPSSVVIVPAYDRSQSIIQSVDDVQTTLTIAFVLVVLVIFVFLGRAADTLIPAIALPLSLLITFLVMQVLGYSLDNLSLMALTLAIGFLVDDAIVFLENCVRRMEHGEPPLTAALNGAKEISFTILAMTVSLAAVFIPLVFMPGLMGRILREFSTTIVVSILASGIVSLTLTPLMCARMLSPRGPDHKKSWVERVIGGVEKWVLEIYGRWLTWFLRHRWISAVTWVLCMLGTVFFFTRVPRGLLPLGDSGFVWGILIAQEGTSPEQMHKYQDVAQDILQTTPGVDSGFTVTGASQFFPTNFGLMLAFLDDAGKRPPIQQFLGMLAGGVMQRTVGVIPALRAQPVLQISTGATNRTTGQYTYSMSGIDANEVQTAARRMVAAMSGSPIFAKPVTTDLFSNTPNLDVEILRDQASLYNVSVARIEALLRNAYSENYLYLIKRPTDQYQVILEVKDSGRREPSDLGLLYVRSDDGRNLIPLSAMVKWKPSIGLLQVNHINQFPSVSVLFNLAEGHSLGDAAKFIDNAAATIVPGGVRASLQGEAKTFHDMEVSMVPLLFLAVFVMYVILGILYESYLHPITVLSSLPVALVGGLAVLYFFNFEATLYAFIGLFMLMGIVKKNGIMVVDFALQRIDEGKDPETAIHDASMDRFRPIMMTTMAALMGAVPIALGFGADAESRRPLGLVIISGLIVSQFITLFVTPVIYLYLEDFQEKVLDRTSFFRSDRIREKMEAAAAAVGINRLAPAPVLAPEGNGEGNGEGGGNGQGENGK
jgi:hydrophobic/amphiphilic exporter-1 (mainly G- bacteria), HAE1 family